MVWYSFVYLGMVWHGTAWYCVDCDAVIENCVAGSPLLQWYALVWYSMAKYVVGWYGMARYILAW